MRHRASRRCAVAAFALLALAVAGAGVALVTSSRPHAGAVTSARSHDDHHARHEAVTPRAALSPTASAAHGSGLHVDVLAALAAVSAGALLLLGWVVVGRVRHRLPRLVTAALGARAPPALV
jgi:hypothetical protein